MHKKESKKVLIANQISHQKMLFMFKQMKLVQWFTAHNILPFN